MLSVGRKEYEALPMERFYKEFEKAMKGPQPQVFLELLSRVPSAISAMKVFMPEIGQMARTPLLDLPSIILRRTS